MARTTTLNNVPYLHLAAFDAALRVALPGKVFGINASVDATGQVTVRNNPTQQYPTGQIINGQFQAVLDDITSPDDEKAAQSTADKHDPVFITADKTSILANGSDVAMVTVTAPKQNAAPVVLLINSLVTPVPIKAGLGQVKLSSPVVGTLNISLQNPANRTTDTLNIQAVAAPPPPVTLPTIVVM